MSAAVEEGVPTSLDGFNQLGTTLAAGSVRGGKVMASFNRVILVGNLTRDPNVRYTPGGTAVCDIGLAVDERRKNQSGEWVDEVVYVDVTLWGRTAEVAGEYLTKGAPVLVEGRLRMDTWEKNGEKRSKLRVVADRMQMLGTREQQANSGPRLGTGVAPTPEIGDAAADKSGFSPDDDVPF